MKHSYTSFQLSFVLSSLEKFADFGNPTDSCRRAYYHIWNLLSAYASGTNLPDTDIAFFYAFERAYKYGLSVLIDGDHVFEIIEK